MSEIKRIGGTVNAVVVQLPERQHPGVVVQYDNMHNLLNLVRDAKLQMLKNDWDEVRDILDEIDDLVSGYAKALEK
jgi:hypothetical protein